MAQLSAERRKLRGRHAGLARHRGPDHPDTVESRRDLEAQRLRDHVAAALEGATPLTPQQCHEIGRMLAAGVRRARGGDQ